MKRVETKSVPMTDFTDMPVLIDQFPLAFENGYRWTEFTGHCVQCKRKIDSREMHGNVVPVLDETYRARVTKMYYIDALGRCEKCDLLTPFKYGITSDGHLIGIKTVGKQTFIEVYARDDELSWWKRAWKRTKRFFGSDR